MKEGEKVGLKEGERDGWTEGGREEGRKGEREEKGGSLQCLLYTEESGIAATHCTPVERPEQEVSIGKGGRVRGSEGWKEGERERWTEGGREGEREEKGGEGGEGREGRGGREGGREGEREGVSNVSSTLESQALQPLTVHLLSDLGKRF